MTTMKSLLTFLVIVSSFTLSRGFVVPSPNNGRAATLNAAPDTRRMGELTDSETKVFDFLQSLHDSKYNFRIVVVGNGAILETTSVLGPAVAVAQSPKTGKNLMTLASEDKSFEFHLHLADVEQISVLEKETPMKTMRLVRILGAEGQSMCSLILADTSDEACEWFHKMKEEYGETIDLS